MSQGKLTTSLLFAVVPLVAACVETDEPEVGTEAQAKMGGCGTWGCGSNSPEIETWDFHELNEFGLPNEEGVVVNGMVKDGVQYQVGVVGAKLYGYPLSAGVPVLEGIDLRGAYLSVTTEDDSEWQIYINNVSNLVHYWIDPSTPNETYELYYTKPGVLSRPVCKDPPGRVDGEGPIWWRQYEAILYTGDRYNSDDFTVTDTAPRSTQGWFNVGCAGSALAKLHLNRHTTAGANSTHVADWADRQAMLKMYTADICGTGDASTKQGEPLHWGNAPGWNTLTGTETSYEALWNENGAICLEEHRLQADALLWSAAEASIKAACTLPDGTVAVPPPCSSMFPDGFTNFPAGYILTANP